MDVQALTRAQVMYALVEEAPCYQANLRAHQRLFDVLLEEVRRRRLVVRRKEVALGRQYQALYERWRTHLTGDPLPCLPRPTSLL